MRDQYGIDIPHVSPETLLDQVSKVFEAIEGCAYVVLLGPMGDPSNIRARTNVSDDHANRMLQKARDTLKKIIRQRTV